MSPADAPDAETKSIDLATRDPELAAVRARAVDRAFRQRAVALTTAYRTFEAQRDKAERRFDRKVREIRAGRFDPRPPADRTMTRPNPEAPWRETGSRPE